MLSIVDIIGEINNNLLLTMKWAKLYGAAYSIDRDGKIQPVVNDSPVGFDDVYPLSAYHKINGAVINYKPGAGRNENVVNTFSLSFFIFNNKNKTGLYPDEVAMIFQSAFSKIKIDSVRINPTSIILNSQQIYASEYRGSDYRLSENQSLIQINYNVEVTFKNGCFDICPEDFSQCKFN